MSAWLRDSGEGVVLSLHVQSGAKQTEVIGLHGASLKIGLAAPTVDGKANECLLEYLADTLNMPKRKVTLVSELSSPSKRVVVVGMTAEEIERRLVG